MRGREGLVDALRVWIRSTSAFVPGQEEGSTHTLPHDGERRAEDCARGAVVLLQENLADGVEVCEIEGQLSWRL